MNASDSISRSNQGACLISQWCQPTTSKCTSQVLSQIEDITKRVFEKIQELFPHHPVTKQGISNGSNTNSLGLSSLNVPSRSFYNNIYRHGCNIVLSTLKSLNFNKPYDSNRLSKLLSLSCSNNTFYIKTTLAASPQLSVNLTESHVQQALMMCCEGVQVNRSSSPTESDTSGIGSISELGSISDHTRNLNLGTVVEGSGVTSSNSTLNEDQAGINSAVFEHHDLLSIYKYADGKENNLLKAKVSTEIAKCLNKDNCLKTLLLSDTYKDQLLKSSVINYIILNRVVLTEEWNEFVNQECNEDIALAVYYKFDKFAISLIESSKQKV